MNTNSNTYTIIYASVMVVIVAFLLAFISSSLKPMQDANVERDTKNQILTALNVQSADVDADYAMIVEDLLFQDGQLVPYEGAFNTSYGTEINNGNLHVFRATMEDGTLKYVIPMTGRGLWGGLWGYIALNDDLKTVFGAYFSHESETAGLGALIAERPFQESFVGKEVFDETDEVAITVVKKGSVKNDKFEIDGVTGATLTSVGVAAMVNEGLKKYDSFLKSAQTPACCQQGEGECCQNGEGTCCQEGESCCEKAAEEAAETNEGGNANE